jgi:hypothetical protein
MPGIPEILDLSFLRGAELIQVCLGVWQVQLHFSEPPATIAIEGDWEMTDEQGRVIDQSSDAVRQQPFHLHLLLQRVVTAVEVSAPLSFALRFTGGLVLRVFASSQGYESFSIQPGNIFV